MGRVFLNGQSLELDCTGFAGRRVLERFQPDSRLPGPEEPPYLFCGNGACRDCNVLIEGLPDLPTCRLPLCPGLSLRTRDADGAENALSLGVGETLEEAPLRCQIAVVGAGRAGREAARAAREKGAEVVLFEARQMNEEGVLGATPAVAIEGSLFCYTEGMRRPVAADAVVIATGAFELVPPFAGSTLPGVFPADLVERYLGLGHLPGSRFLVSAAGERGASLCARLLARGAREARTLPEGFELVGVLGGAKVEAARLVAASLERREEMEGTVEVEVDTVIVAGQRLPSLGLARALGCSLRYHAALGGDCADLDQNGASSVPGVFIAGDAAWPGSLEAARASGERAGIAAALWRAGRR
jgi:NADPH-dependent 2,4-dienoyl-CoA reductase/sulfur reductase-like enzyme